ncbi:hypothetical protein [Arthrobacter sp. B3I4]|uniref:DUF7793 family protein n=1 Tax=Arthrobacter sp. B3I4 TaxID=3042267 RepID=UPI00278A2151|nr:hypothetical protein [Arthrobacter sp. B3I4]MDQ0754085.1 hypothetical protein [Arthrobacter sp. B3I4]
MTVEAPAAPEGRLPEQVQAPTAAPDAEAPPSSVPALELTVTKPDLARLEAELGLTGPSAADVAVAGAEVAGAELTGAPVIDVRLLQCGVIEVALPPNREIEGPEARAAGAAVRALANGKRMAVLLVISGVVGVSVEARQVYAGSIAAAAFALVGESPVDRVIAHYLLRSRTESIPAEFFSSRTAALEWLRPYTSEK